MKNLFKFLGIVFVVILFATCTKEYFLDIPEEIYQYTGLSFFETPQGECKLRTWYLDRDGSGFYTNIMDTILGYDTLCPGDNRVLSYERFPYGDCEVFLVTFGDDVLLQDTICPEVIHDTVTVVEPDTVYIRLPGDTTIREFVREYFRENFNNPGNSPYYHSLGWDLSCRDKNDKCLDCDFSINQISSSTGNGTIVLDKDVEESTIWSPELFSEPMSVDSLVIPVGSLNDYGAEILLQDESGQIFVVATLNSFEEFFDWQNIVTFNYVNYSVSINNIEYLNIVKAGIHVIKQGNFSPETRNEKFNSDDWFIRGIKEIE